MSNYHENPVAQMLLHSSYDPHSDSAHQKTFKEVLHSNHVAIGIKRDPPLLDKLKHHANVRHHAAMAEVVRGAIEVQNEILFAELPQLKLQAKDLEEGGGDRDRKKKKKRGSDDGRDSDDDSKEDTPRRDKDKADTPGGVKTVNQHVNIDENLIQRQFEKVFD